MAHRASLEVPMLRTGEGCGQKKSSLLCSRRPTLLQAFLSPSSIRHILRVLRAALQDAVDEELLRRNVARLVQLRVTDERKVRSSRTIKQSSFFNPPTPSPIRIV